jgi:hypothetical protein
MNAPNPIKSFVKRRFPQAAAAYVSARHRLTSPWLATVFSTIYHTNAWQDPESASGRGSTLARTKVIMAQLPLLLVDLHAKTLLDAACGDFNWMRHTDLRHVNYIGVDVVPALIARNQQLFQNENRKFASLDITRDKLPAADAILCRDCFIHLCFRNIKAAVKNFKLTGATHLFCTTHTTITSNTDCPDGSWRSLNLQLPPFNFPSPVRLIVEDEELGKCLGVWRLEEL